MADITVSEATGFGLATVLLLSPLPFRGGAGGGASPDSSASGEGPHPNPSPEGEGLLGFPVVSGPVASGNADVTLLGTGPNQWLAYTQSASPDWAEALGEKLAGTAAVVDQSGAYTMLQMTGADARRCLQKGLPVDLSPIACPLGTVIVSIIAHMGVIVHHAAPDQFRCFVFRSYTISFREWLHTTIAAL